MVHNGDLGLLSDYIVVGLDGGFEVFPQLLEVPRDVSGYIWLCEDYKDVYWTFSWRRGLCYSYG